MITGKEGKYGKGVQEGRNKSDIVDISHILRGNCYGRILRTMRVVWKEQRHMVRANIPINGRTKMAVCRDRARRNRTEAVLGTSGMGSSTEYRKSIHMLK